MGRKYLTMMLIAIAAIVTDGCKTQAVAQPAGAVSFGVFYSELSPYGMWVQDPAYGYVWVPDAGPGFQPYYTNGYWVMTEYGNTWVSRYSWGWAPFHYGRWIYDSFYGWVWVPGYDWGPAWVYWRYGGGYYGWAPLTPGFTVTVSFGAYTCPADWWIFLPPQYLYRKNFTHHVRDRRQNMTIYNNTTVINNTYTNRTRNTVYITGPTRERYKEVSGNDVTVHRINDMATQKTTYTRSNNVYMYRPDISRDAKDAAPANAVRATRPVSDPVPVSTNENREAPFIREMEQSRPVRQTPQERTPAQRTPTQREPIQRTPTQREPVQQRTPTQREPIQRTPTQREPVQRTPTQRTPTQRAPVQRTPQRTTPTQRTQPTQQKTPERTSPSSQPVRGR